MSNAQKTPLSRTLSLFGQRKALDEIAKRGQALPGHVTSVVGQIVTINFDVAGLTLPQVSMPVYGSEYIRLPIQNGDKGVAFPASVYIGGVSGLGTGTGDDTLQGNLSTLVWLPIGNANWTVPTGSDANTLALYGHAGLLLLDALAGNASVKLTSSGITLTFGNGSITMNSSGITLTFSGKSVVISSSGVSIEGKEFLTHEHQPGTYVAPSGGGPVTGDSGVVV